MNTFVLKAPEIKRNWYLIDAAGQPLGRVAARAAHILTGKHKPSYTKHLDNGDFVVVINAGQTILTGRKSKNKKYFKYSGYVGGLRETPFLEMIQKKPSFPIQVAVKGMLPHNNLSRKMIKKLYLFSGAEHTFQNVNLVPVEL